MDSFVLRGKVGKSFRVILLWAAVAVPAGAAKTKVCGFVTRIASQSEFYLGPLHIIIGPKTQCISENLDADIRLRSQFYGASLERHFFVLRDKPEPQSGIAVQCNGMHLRVGTYVEIDGGDKSSDGPLRNTRVTVYRTRVRQRFVKLPKGQEWEGGSLIEEKPHVKRVKGGWSGTMWLDGYPMRLTPRTLLLAAPLGSELAYRPFHSLFGWPSVSKWGAVVPDATVPTFTSSLLQPNTWATYRAREPSGAQLANHDAGSASGKLDLAQLQLWPGEVSAREREYQVRLAPLVRLPNYAHHISGSVGFEGQPTERFVKVLASGAVQAFIAAVGESLVPVYQKALADGDQTKIHFGFDVVQGGHPSSRDTMSQADWADGLLLSRRDVDRGVFASPGGLIAVPDYVLARSHNTAQLAMILSCAIAATLQHQGFIRKGARPYTGDYDGGFDPSRYLFTLFQNEQALRIGIRQMYLAGYDIREAPFAWALAAGKPAVNPVVDSKHSDREIPWYAAYAFNYISEFYSDADYSKLKRGRAEYAQFLKELRHADPEAFEQSRK